MLSAGAMRCPPLFILMIAALTTLLDLPSTFSLKFKVPVHKADTSEIHERIRKNLQRQSWQSTTLTSEIKPIEPLTSNDIRTLFYGMVEIGSPPQKFKFIFDTGSSDMWVVSGPSRYCKRKTCYYSVLSNTYAANNTAFDVTYGSGSVSGVLASDTVEFAGVPVIGQTLGLVTSEEEAQLESLQDGILGLGFPNLSEYMTPPFFNMMKQNIFDVNAFSFHLSKQGDENSSIFFGGWDDAIVKSEKDLKWIPITEKAYWKFSLDSMTIGNVTFNNTQAIADTGTSLIVGPPEDVRRIAVAIGAVQFNNLLLVPKDRVSSLPDLKLVINGLPYKLTPMEYVVMTAGNVTVLGIGPGSGIDFWILGDAFLANYYTIFNVDRGAVAFADLPTPESYTTQPPTKGPTTTASPTSTVPTTAKPSGSSPVTSCSYLLLFALLYHQIVLYQQ